MLKDLTEIRDSLRRQRVHETKCREYLTKQNKSGIFEFEIRQKASAP